MIIETNYGLKKLDQKLRADTARIGGVCTHEQCRYYIVEDFEEQRIDHVLCAMRPSWERRYGQYID